MERTLMQNARALNLSHRGLLIVDKPAGLTSTLCVAAIRGLLPPGTKVGHAGTLDAFATGVLIVMVGKATRSCETLMSLPKEYEATIKFGMTTATDDPDSPEKPYQGAGARPTSALREDAIVSALARFKGTIHQRPPDYSALKFGGKRFSDRVRAGEHVRPEPRPVRIDEIELLEFSPPTIRIRVTCGRGTYIRSIARDLGDSLRVGAYVTRLRRTRIGPYLLASANPLASLDASNVLERLTPTVD